MAAVLIERKLCISNQHTLYPWQPIEKIIDDKSYIQLKLWDKKFFRFCTGKAMKMGIHGCDPRTQFFDDLTSARSRASQKTWEDQNRDLQNGDAPKKRAKIRACKASDAAVCGEVVSVHVEHNGKSMDMNLLFGCKKHPVFVEASAGNLAFIAEAISKDSQEGRLHTYRRWKHRKGDEEDDSEAAHESE
jgi:hypothetical protein